MPSLPHIRKGRSGRPWQRVRLQVLAASTVCWICGHPGSTTVDHVKALALGGSLLDPANLRPAHGVEGCSTCGRKCNSSRGTRPVAPPVRSRNW